MILAKISMGAIAVSCVMAMVFMALRCGDTTILEAWLTAFRAARQGAEPARLPQDQPLKRHAGDNLFSPGTDLYQVTLSAPIAVLITQYLFLSSSPST